MKRILVAIFLLIISASIAFWGSKSLLDKLDELQSKTNSAIKTSTSEELEKSWEDSEKTFALILSDEKYKDLERQISKLKSLDDEREFIICCNEILFEIEEIRRSHMFLIENVL